jgi:hypothetical protein
LAAGPYLYTRHLARPAHGVTANRRYDGPLHITTSFTVGFGSSHGPGYVLNCGFATLESVSADDRAMMEEAALAMIHERLPKAFPGRDVRIERDGEVWKITGDLSLDG